MSDLFGKEIINKSSYRASSKNRNSNDFYQTPSSIVKQLLEVENFNSVILEPCCGNNAIVNVLLQNGYDVISYDLFHGENRKDFLTETEKYKTIITNPPFKMANEFIIKSFNIVTDKSAFLLPLDYLHGKYRYDKIFSIRKPSRIYVFVRRPLFEKNIRNDGLYKTGSTTFAWFIFDMVKSGKDDPNIKFIDNSEYVLRKKYE